MYKSPIDIILGEFELKFEDGICKAVREVGIVVDKDELLRALKYDRDQYDKGYKDALATVEVEVTGMNRRYRKINDTIGEYREILGM